MFRNLHSIIKQQIRTKITVCKLDASKSSSVQRPTPILLLRTEPDSLSMQTKFSQLGYFTVDAVIDLPEKTHGQSLLDTCYQELSKATSDLSFFPPLLVSHGEIAARISEKFVSNKPVSGLVMIVTENSLSDTTGEFPHSEFEPRFPICMISNGAPPEFLDGWIDHVDLKKGQEFEDLTQWMDEVGM